MKSPKKKSKFTFMVYNSQKKRLWRCLKISILLMVLTVFGDRNFKRFKRSSVRYAIRSLTDIRQCILSKSGYPDLSVLMDLYLCFYIYPVTDFNHPMITPAVHLLGQVWTLMRALQEMQMLNSCCIVDPQSCLMALLAVSIALEYMQRANRYIPEAIAALYSISDYLYVQRILVVMTVQVGWTDQSFASVYQYHVLFVFVYSFQMIIVNGLLILLFPSIMKRLPHSFNRRYSFPSPNHPQLPFFFLTNSLSPSIEYRDLILCQLYSMFLSFYVLGSQPFRKDQRFIHNSIL